jgi:hypothetical protein
MERVEVQKSNSNFCTRIPPGTKLATSATYFSKLFLDLLKCGSI